MDAVAREVEVGDSRSLGVKRLHVALQFGGVVRAALLVLGLHANRQLLWIALQQHHVARMCGSVVLCDCCSDRLRFLRPLAVFGERDRVCQTSIYEAYSNW